MKLGFLSKEKGEKIAVGIIGLGKMGGNMARRLIKDGQRVLGFDQDPSVITQLEKEGVSGTSSLEDLVMRLEKPRNIWIMLPHGKATQEAIGKVMTLLEKGDLVLDGGNSYYQDSRRIAERCANQGIEFLDVGISGGIWGLESGYNLMVGGSEDAFARMEPAFKSLTAENGYAHVGPAGAGHFVKMIHNALEYAMLQSLGEAFECLKQSEFDLDLKQISDLWQHGAVVQSWLLSLLSRAFEEEGNDLKKVGDYVEDSGMGRWTMQYAVENGIPVPAISIALFERFASRQDKRFSAQIIAALRKQFGGHTIKEDK